MSNAERVRRGFTSLDFCVFCMGHVKDISHIWRFCLCISEIWPIFLLGVEITMKNSLSVGDWIFKNLEKSIPHFCFEEWPVTFSMIVWWNWILRNDYIFNGKCQSIDFKIHWLKAQGLEVTNAFASCARGGKIMSLPMVK